MTESVTIRLAGPPRSVAVASVRRGASAPPLDEADEQAARAEQARQELDAERQRLAKAREALGAAADQLDKLRADLLAEAEQQLVGLAVGIARKVLMQEIQAQRYEIDPIVAEALKQVPARQDVTVHLNPDDLARCEAAGQGSDSSESIQFVADWAVRPAECLIETREGTVESSIEAHLDEVAAALRSPE